MTLRDAVLGGWELVSFVARDAATGEETHPLGSAADELAGRRGRRASGVIACPILASMDAHAVY
ncbi:hypothetical protein [Mycobacterium sp.]|uniref:hypothetical protein n=1 Tax=Mycobacterium sp. TaxID=1785 RepID=UPI003D0FF55E